jgi:hypothetical protein
MSVSVINRHAMATARARAKFNSGGERQAGGLALVPLKGFAGIGMQPDRDADSGRDHVKAERAVAPDIS